MQLTLCQHGNNEAGSGQDHQVFGHHDRRRQARGLQGEGVGQGRGTLQHWQGKNFTTLLWSSGI